MSTQKDDLYSKKLFLLALKGHITVYLTNDDTLAGKFIAQDEFNIFLTIDDEPVMVPRHQIRYIKGQPGQPVELDTSQETFSKHQARPVKPTQPYQLEVIKTSASLLDSEDAGDVIEEEIDRSTLILEPSPGLSPVEVLDVDDEYDGGTIVLDQKVDDPSFETQDMEKDDSGTIVLASTTDALASVAQDMDEDENGTVVLQSESRPSPHEMQDPDHDTSTFVIQPGTDLASMQMQEVEEDEEDGTFIIQPSANLPISSGGNPSDATILIDEAEIEDLGQLICTTGPHLGDVFKLQNRDLTIGRSMDNIIALPQDKEISRRHAVINRKDDKFIIQDQGSLNGTFVNDQLIETTYELKDGDIILVGVSTLKYQAK